MRRAASKLNHSQASVKRPDSFSVKRSVKSRAGTEIDKEPFYLPDIKANYSEYSKDDRNYAIPKSLHHVKPYASGPMVNGFSRFRTPNRQSQNNKQL